MLNLLRGEAGVEEGTLPIQTSNLGGDHAASTVSFGASRAIIDASSAGPIVLDGEILLKGDYSRHGADLTIVGPDGDSVTLTGYFDAGAPDLHSADGAMLAGKTVSLLAGPESPGEYAQAGAAPGGNSIGSIQLLEGTATVQRASGVVEPLQVGSAVFEDDVVSTGAGSKLSVKFVDGTALSMSADARMIMDELVYDPGRTDNSMVLNLVQGSFVFVTGLVAKTGSVRADTPVATMGIRGTTPTVSIDSVTRATTFGIAPDPDGTIGSYVIVNLQTGQLLGTVNSTSFLYRLASVGGVLQQIPATDGDSDALQLLQDTYQTFGQPGSQPGGQPNQDGGGEQNNNQPPPDQRGDVKPPIEPIGTDVATTLIDDLGGELDLLTVAELIQFGDEEDDDLDIEPSIAPPPDSFEAGPGGDTGSSASVFAFNGPSGVDEDGSVVLSGFDIQYTGTVGVDIVAGSTVTLATTAGLTFLKGDGVDDEEMEFYGSADAVRAALEGAIYKPTGNSNIGSLVITFFDASGSNVIGSVSVPVTVTPVPDAPIARNDFFFDIPEDAGRGSAPFRGNLFADNSNGIDYDPDNYASGRPPAGAAPTGDFYVSRFRVDADRDGSFADENWIEVAPGTGGTFIIETGQYAGLTGTISRNGDFTITPGPGFDNLSAGESGFLGSLQYEITSTVDGRTGTGLATGFVTGQAEFSENLGFELSNAYPWDSFAASTSTVSVVRGIAIGAGGAPISLGASEGTQFLAVGAGSASNLASLAQFAGLDFVEGTNGDEILSGVAYDPNRSDWIRPLDSTPGAGNQIIATGGNDFIDFEGASGGWNQVDYSRTDFGVSGNINVDLTSDTAFVTKESGGRDTWYNVDQITDAGGLGIYTGPGNHFFAVDATIPDFLELGIGRGHSTLIAVNEGNLRVNLQAWNGVTVDAAAGFAEETGGGAYLDVTGFVRQWGGTSGNDTLRGSDAGEIFITQGGTNTVDGRGGHDTMRYDRSGVTYLNVVYSAPGTAIATGLWFGQFFVDTLSDIEEVRGGRTGASLVQGSDGVDVFAGRGSHNSFAGLGGDDVFTGSGGQDLIVLGTGGGVDTINAFTIGQDLIDLTLLGVTDLTELATFEFADGKTVIRSNSGDGADVIGVDLTNVAPEQAFILSRIIGTTGDDNAGGAGELIGTDSNDMILGRAGDDTLRGGDGHDILRSGGSVLDWEGEDRLYGDDGNDVLVAEGGFTTMVGGAGNDIMIATFEFGDRFWDVARVDYSDSQNGIIANLTSAQRSGVAAMRVADGEGGLDTLININQIRDSAWDDQFFIDNTYSNFRNGFVEVRLSAGNDSVSFLGVGGRISYRNAAEGVNASLERGNAVELDGIGPDHIGFDQFTGATELRGSFHGDWLEGNSANNFITGSAGNDAIFGGGGFDYVGFGDSPSGVIVDLSLSFNQVIDDGHGRVDTLTSIESVSGSLWSDDISGDDNANNLEGGTGDDYLFGAGGSDYLSGDFGNGGGLLGGDDILDGGEGNDTLHGGDGADTFVFAGNHDHDYIDDFDFDEGDRIDISGQGFSSVGDFYAFLYDSGLQATIARFSESNSVTLWGVDLTQPGYRDDAFIFDTFSGFSFMAFEPAPESMPVFTGTQEPDTFVMDDGVSAQFENFDPANDTIDISALLDTPFNAAETGSFAYVDANWLSDGTADSATLFVDADGSGTASGFDAVASLAFDKPVSETVINLVFEQSAEAVQVQAAAAA